MPQDEMNTRGKTAETCEIMLEPTDDETIIKLIQGAKTVAVVGMSSSPRKDSHIVGRYLREAGYEVFPVHPSADEIAGMKVYHALVEIPGPVDVVDIFRPGKEVPSIVDEAIGIGAKAVWMQEGIVNHAAAEKARAAGLDVVMDRCMKKEHSALKRK